MRNKGLSIFLTIVTVLGIYLFAYIFQDSLFCWNKPAISGQVKDSSEAPRPKGGASQSQRQRQPCDQS
jgi:hypothetical protein